MTIYMDIRIIDSVVILQINQVRNLKKTTSGVQVHLLFVASGQGRRQVWNFVGARSNVAGIICPSGWDRVNCSAKHWGAIYPPKPPPCDGPAYFLLMLVGLVSFHYNGGFKISSNSCKVKHTEIIFLFFGELT